MTLHALSSPATTLGMAPRRISGKTRLRHAFVSLAVLAAFLFAFTLSAAPGLHEHFHADAAKAQHECAVTVIDSGKYQLTEPLLGVCCPVLPVNGSTVSALTPVWVAAPFLSAAVLEHAPPAFS